MKFLFDRILLPFAAPLLVLIIWELIAIELKNDVVLPTVGQVWVLFLHPNEDLLRLGSLLQNLVIRTRTCCASARCYRTSA